ncbi:MAG: serine hydrolase, partial [Eubacteriales bacterium]|nr:serine hydrolase [Eubacteriales bacterium]
ALALSALEHGKLTLDDPLTMFFSGVPADKRGITVGQLLTHTSGLPPYFPLEQEADGASDAAQAILAHPLDERPGRRVRESAMGFVLLGLLLEKALRLPLDEAARRYVFSPLGMTLTDYLPSGANIAACGLDPATGEPLVGVAADENARFLHGVSGSAGVFTTLNDCLRFAGMLAHEGAPLLAPATVRLARRNHTRGLDEAFGLGFRLKTGFGDLWSGDTFGLTAPGGCLAVDPVSGLAAALLLNPVETPRGGAALPRLRRLALNQALAEAQKSLR